MPEKGLSLLGEYRHWRASLPVGAFMLLSAYLFTVDMWPELASRPGSIFTHAAAPVARLASPAAVWLILIAASMMLGSWWGEVSSWVVGLVQRGLVMRLPLENPSSSWTLRQRLRLPFHLSEMRHLQNAMMATADYSDLLEIDQRKAYLGFLGEVFSTPHSAGADASRADDELIRSVTDLRLSAGLLPWLPLAFIGLAINVEEAAPKGFILALWVCAIITFAAVVLSVTRQSRATSTLAVRLGSTPMRLGHHARNAQGASQ